jgi:hypothetical protein
MNLKDVFLDIPLSVKIENMTFDNEFRDWMARLNKAEKPQKDIVAFNYGLFETTEGYTMYLIGVKNFDEDDEAGQLRLTLSQKKNI